MKHIILSLLSIIALNTTIQAQEFLDGSFNGTGRVTNSYGMFFSKVAIQPDQKILVAGIYSEPALLRFQSNGSLDTQFGNGGLAVVNPWPGISVSLKSLVALTDGNILLSGSFGDVYQKLFIVKLHYNGAIDSSFGTNGIVINDTSFGDCSSSLYSFDYTGGYIQSLPDGRIIQVGTQNNLCAPNDPYHWVGKYLSNGLTDTSFHFGISGIHIFNQVERLKGVFIDEDSTIIAYGSGSGTGEDSLLSVPKYIISSPSGETGLSGGAIPSPNRSQILYNVEFMKRHKDGCIIGGSFVDNGKSRVCVGRIDSLYKAAYAGLGLGKIDSSFGVNGYSIIDFPGGGEAIAAEVVSGNKILLIGTSDALGFSKRDFTLIRLNENGSRDLSFGNNGIVITDFSNSDELAYSAAMQADGKLVIVGGSNPGITRDELTILRYGNTPLSVDRLSSMDLPLAYPNPFSDHVTVDTKGKSASLQITDVNGRKIGTITSNGDLAVIHTATYAPGIYIIQVTTNDGVSSQRLFKP